MGAALPGVVQIEAVDQDIQWKSQTLPIQPFLYSAFSLLRAGNPWHYLKGTGSNLLVLGIWWMVLSFVPGQKYKKKFIIYLVGSFHNRAILRSPVVWTRVPRNDTFQVDTKAINKPCSCTSNTRRHGAQEGETWLPDSAGWLRVNTQGLPGLNANFQDCPSTVRVS